MSGYYHNGKNIGGTFGRPSGPSVNRARGLNPIDPADLKEMVPELTEHQHNVLSYPDDYPDEVVAEVEAQNAERMVLLREAKRAAQ